MKITYKKIELCCRLTNTKMRDWPGGRLQEVICRLPKAGVLRFCFNPIFVLHPLWILQQVALAILKRGHFVNGECPFKNVSSTDKFF